MEERPKTYKREVACVMLVLTFGLAIGGAWEPQAMAVAEIMVWPVFMFAGAAFGLDAFAKQIR